MRGKLLSRAGLTALAFGADAAAALSASQQPAAPAAATPAPPAPAPAAAAPAEGAEQQPAAEPGAEAVPAPPAAAAPATADPAIAENGDYCLASDALALATAAEQKGWAAANARAQLVLQDEACLKDPATAAFFLFNSEANAATIIGQVKARPGAGTAAAKPGAAQPRINLTGGNGAAAAAAEGAEDGGKDKTGGDFWSQFAPAGGTGGPNALTIGGQTYNVVPAAPAQ